MKATGIIRRIDDLGRVVIPKELRRTLSINENDPMEIFTEDGSIVFRPYRVGCFCCGNEEGLITVNDMSLCSECVQRFMARIPSQEHQEEG